LNKKIVAEGTPKKIFSDADLLKEMNLEVPAVTYLFKMLSCFGYDPQDLPMSMDEAVSHLTDKIESGGGHLHLHIHEHTHEKLRKLGEEHGHH
jgi:cobalt/nickel transport system ATP-binding protein